MRSILFSLSFFITLTNVNAQATPQLDVYQTNPTLSLFYEVSQCYYQSGKYTNEELKNTEMLTDGATSGNYSFENIFIKSGLKNQLLQTKVKEYIKTCKLVKGVYWEQLRKDYLKKYEYETDFDNIKEEAIKDPSVLLSGRFSTYCTEYIKALNGTDDELKIAWRKLVEQKAAKNSLPQHLWKRFDEDSKSADWKFHAREDLISFGWGNCVNRARHDKNAFYTIDENAEEMFRKLFIKIEEPDDDHEH